MQESKQLRQALLNAYPRQGDLELLVAEGLNENLEAIAGGDNYSQVAFNLIQWAKARSQYNRLIEAIYEDNPDNEQLQTFYRQRLQRLFSESSSDRDFGPSFNWKGRTDPIELQSWFKPESKWLDIGFLKQAIARAASVCRIEISDYGVVGTGVLIGDRQVLTNYHVFQPHSDADVRAIAERAILRFGCYTSDTGDELEGQVFELDSEHPLLSSSPIQELDYLLLQVEEKIGDVQEIQPAPLEYDRVPFERMGLNILQHPEGAAMKIAISTNGITGVYRERGLIQYVTQTAGGSSGAPCFNEDWKLVALHHAQRVKGFGTIREGILLNSIYSRIQLDLK